MPIALKAKQADANITAAGATGWMDSLDPLFGRIADVWMKTMIADFGTDHWYQLDGYFNGGTAPWLALSSAGRGGGGDDGPHVSGPAGPVVADPAWRARASAAYAGLSRTDPMAVWSFQGWAFVGWEGEQKASWLRGFVEGVPPGKFVLMDMSVDGDGEWKKWDDAAYWGAPFIWTTLHDFGGTDGLKGNLSRLNQIPWLAIEAGSAPLGTGATPEGIDQNPLYYEFALSRNWAAAREPDVMAAVLARAHRRYGLAAPNDDIAAAWRLLTTSAYAQDLSVQSSTGIAHLPGTQAWSFGPDRRTPTPTMCAIHAAWAPLRHAAPAVRAANGGELPETFRYDLVNLGREILAQLSTPLSRNFTDALGATPLSASALTATATPYLRALADVDALLATDAAFLLGPWLRMARSLGSDGAADCGGSGIRTITSCADFYEWNARVQLTTWNPTRADDYKVPSGPVDYAGKHWAGLVMDYYRERAALSLQRALVDAATGGALNTSAAARITAQHAYRWTTAKNAYPQTAVGDAVVVSEALAAKYAAFFAACDDRGPRP